MSFPYEEVDVRSWEFGEDEGAQRKQKTWAIKKIKVHFTKDGGQASTTNRVVQKIEQEK